MLDARFLKSSLYFGVSLLSVQGTAYLLQVIAAAQTSTTDYSAVRVTESSAAVGALIMSFGIPSALLVLSASAKSQRQRTSVVLTALTMTLIVTSAIGSAALLTSTPVSVIAMAFLISLRIFLSATTQARQEFKILALASVVSCVVSLFTYFILQAVHVPAYHCWICARLALELALVMALLVVELYSAKEGPYPITAASFKLISMLALPLGASLALRSLVEHGPILWLAQIGAPVDTAAQVGIVVTLGTIALVPATVAQSVMVPRLASDVSAINFRAIANVLALCAGITTVALMAGLAAAALIVPWATIATPALAAGAILVVLAKMTASISGGLLLVLRRGRTILLLNAASLIVSLSVALLAKDAILAGLDSTGVVWLIAFVETGAASFYIVSLRQSLRMRR